LGAPATQEAAADVRRNPLPEDRVPLEYARIVERQKKPALPPREVAWKWDLLRA